MKRSHVKAWIVATLAATTIGTVAATGPTPSAKTMGYYHGDNTAVHTDINNIDNDREAVKHYKLQLKEDRKADNTVGVIVDKKEISKAKADLKKDKRYLRADKKDLSRDHRASICATRKEMRKTKKDLRTSRRLMNRELDNGNYAEARKHMENSIRLTTVLNNQQTALANERADFKNDRVAIRKEMRDERRDENAYAKTSVSKRNDESYSENKGWFR